MNKNRTVTILLILSILVLLFFNCKRHDSDSKIENTKTNKTPVVTSIDIYIENSLSMSGYINGNTSFKNNIRELITELEYFYGKNKVNLFLINSAIHPINVTNKTDFVTQLNPSNFNVGKTNESNLNNVFKQVLNRSSENKISFLISDCIYSVSGNAAPLSVQKNGIKNAFLNKSNNGINLSTEIVKLNSRFNGIYYDKNNGRHQLNNQDRPFYILAIGEINCIKKLNSKIPFDNDRFEGYIDKLMLSTKNFSDNYYSLVKTNSDKGVYSFSNDRTTQSRSHKRGIENIRKNNNQFSFSIGVDFSDTPIPSSYILDKNNYKIRQGSFNISSVIEVNDNDLNSLKPNSIAMLKNNNKRITHIITFTSTSNSQNDLECALIYKIPNWVYDTSILDDTRKPINKDKTFGFNYLVEGINEANELISKTNKTIFTIKIKIE
ncbi:hypothetical protein ACSVH5_11765 [Flavobacterium sp. RSSA_27]|uniref:hypothetical protein n=1 Tax=Flavobacterium sp. RSSA_27 TaxID=3447667 RepID=UPI003F35D952